MTEPPVAMTEEALQALDAAQLKAHIRAQESQILRFYQKQRQLMHQMNEMRLTHAEIQNKAEAEEELIANTLFKKLESLEEQKNKLLIQVEQEEEYLTNTLQRKLRELEKEKIDIEIRLEKEQEYIVNRLGKQLHDLLKEKEDLQKEIDDARAATAQLQASKSELEAAKEEADKSIADLTHQNFLLAQQVELQRQKLEAINRQKLELEKGLEIDTENSFNRSSSPARSGAARMSLALPSPHGHTSSVSSMRSPRTSIGNIMSAKRLKTGPLWARLDSDTTPSPVNAILSERGVLLGFNEGDASKTEPLFRINLDKVKSIEMIAVDSFLIKTDEKERTSVLLKAADPKDASEWHSLLESLASY